MPDAILTATPQRFSLQSLVELAESANHTLENLRSKMLDPHPRKRAPTYTGAQLAALCGV